MCNLALPSTFNISWAARGLSTLFLPLSCQVRANPVIPGTGLHAVWPAGHHRRSQQAGRSLGRFPGRGLHITAMSNLLAARMTAMSVGNDES